jgi:phosphopantetheine adenylyltransferase
LIEPTAQRISIVKELIADLRPSVDSDVVPIVDPFGPSIVKPDIECLVVSEETLRGGHAVNKKREEKVCTYGFITDSAHSRLFFRVCLNLIFSPSN